ncbi:hypothetical protein FRC12_012375 [Ceratobasidium sp. 428]|nr:hypothetical protein FRC12_012375 [Ceratobasidium sp. 428]
MMFSATSVLLAALSFASSVLAAPAPINPLKLSGCPIGNAKPNLASLAMPAGTINYVALGAGVQNYSCGATGTFASVGAVATLFDISCFVSGPLMNPIQDAAFAAASSSKGQALLDKMEKIPGFKSFILGHHYFINNPVANATGVSPDFDFRAGAKKGDPTAFAVMKRFAGAASPAGSTNVDFLSLQNIGGAIGGSLASSILRVDTKGGQPPASCTPNSTVSVPYVAKYWLIKA